MPLLHAIAIALLAALVAFVGGCVRGQTAGDAERAALAAQARLDVRAIDTCAASLSAMQQQVLEEMARADAQADAGQHALEQMVRENLDLADKLGQVEQQLASARGDSVCRDQLEVALCASIPLL